MKRFTLMLLLVMFPAMVFAGSITLTWNANTESDLAGYKLYRVLGPCPSSGAVATSALVDVGKVLMYVDTTIPDTVTTVCYDLTAYDTSGNESPHSSYAVKVMSIALPPPTNFRVANGVFTWDVVPGATSYLLRVHEVGTPYTPCEFIVYCNGIGSLTANTITLPLKLGTLYDAWIHSVNVSGVWGSSQGISFTTNMSAPIATPSGFTIK